MDKQIPKLGSDDKYFYIKMQEKLFNMLNRKKLIKISNLWNQKKTIRLVKEPKISYPQKNILNNLRWG